MALVKLCSISHSYLRKNSVSNFTHASKTVTPIIVLQMRQCTTVLKDTRDYELGNFANDLKPFLKTRKKFKHFQDSHYVRPKGEPVIKCKEMKKNHFRNQTYDKFKPIPLASENWKSYKSVGDYFTMSIYTKDFELPENPKKKFEDSDLPVEMIDILNEHDIREMSSVQDEAIYKISEGYNTLIAAETGCGKTLAYLLPVIKNVLKLKKNRDDRFNSPFVIILTPSRELTEQIHEVIQWFKPLDIKSHKILGGHFLKKIFNPNVDNIDFLVATVGIVPKYLATGVYSLKNVRHLILDEADALLDDSFNETTLRVLKKFKFRAEPTKSDETKSTQLTLVSATMPTSIADLLGDVVEVDLFEKITSPNLHKAMPHVPQKFIRINKSTKPAYLLQIAKAHFNNNEPLLIFCNTTSTCNWVSLFLNDNNVENLNLNGDMNLTLRKGRFKQFQSGDVNVLVCTSLAARGLDTTRVHHVLNYEFPSFIVDYIHRCGRTGRLGCKKQGKVTNLISAKNEVALVQKIEKSVRLMSEFENVNPNIKRIINFKGSLAKDNNFDVDSDDESNFKE